MPQDSTPNYYDDADPKGGSAPQGEESSPSQTTMLSKSVCGSKDVKQGDIIKLEVVNVHGDELEVRCADGGEQKPDSSAPPDDDSGASSGSGGDMRSMLED